MRSSELIVVRALRALRANAAARRVANKDENHNFFAVGDLVLVTYGTVFKSAKWPAFRPKFYGLANVLKAQHPCYELFSLTGEQFRQLVHACRFVRYYPRN